MATYKVPQDVEAEDKLLGPFSFRQFIYLVAAILSGGLAYFLATAFLPLAILPLPLALIFLILALPLKKDQPMEIYASAVLAFYLKPRRKLWEPDGIMTMVEFTNDLQADELHSPEITFNEARERISYLSNIVDSSGKIATPQITNPVLQSDVINEANQIEDIYNNDDLAINQRFDQMINQHNIQKRQQIIGQLNNNLANTPSYPSQPVNQSPENYQIPETQSQQTQPANYVFQTSPDIINLANNNDLSVQTIASEAKKINEQNKKILGEEEIVISLR